MRRFCLLSRFSWSFNPSLIWCSSSFSLKISSSALVWSRRDSSILFSRVVVFSAKPLISCVRLWTADFISVCREVYSFVCMVAISSSMYTLVRGSSGTGVPLGLAVLLCSA
ncbi:hypothetical protein FKM82_027537 [Ascaphus truei]